jgi:hypothetical protein
MEYTLIHKDGDIWPSVICAAGQGGDKNKNGVGDKGLYKAITGANKYLLFKLFQIETGDDPETYDPPAILEKDENTQTLTVDAQRPIFSQLQKELSGCETVDETKRWKVAARLRASRLSENWRKILEDDYLKHLRSVEKRDAIDYIERATS